MAQETVTLQVPEQLYTRLQQAAEATRRPLDDVMLHSLEIGSPPRWDDAPAEFQADALDRMDDEALWQIARCRMAEADNSPGSASAASATLGYYLFIPAG